MPLRDRFLAAFVAICWGINFPATALALEHFPPFFLVALRYTLLAVPTLLFIPRPKVPLRWLLGVGVGIGILQFAFLYLGMASGMPSGLASLVLQASAPFTVLIAGIWLHERISRRAAIGVAIAVLGLAAIAVHRAQVAALLPVILTLCAALGWAIGNVSSRQAKAPNPLHLTLWTSVIPPVPMLILSLAVEGPARIGESLATAFTVEALPAVLGLLYVVLIATVVGYGIWNSLLARHPSSVVAPFSMLVPVVGVLASWIAFAEAIDLIELIAGLAVVGGVLYASSGRRPAASPLAEPAGQSPSASAPLPEPTRPIVGR
ncbi:O-acetylserine/cysteine efflux transporter [Glaciihabitans tibetensis]|uniref:O-acetylserine/cysteine efflux transporter n=1 Tax=Glaciihabitans tibetensis TaxID=1266600 RepID=A0A2T0VJ53_9MICO|nr:EamA family transporter [Glaciihabitans tibetensis]PRY70256.1 O-acetylserine/cysteine efflux transporter [Glaciihabitans tibetensis]